MEDWIGSHGIQRTEAIEKDDNDEIIIIKGEDDDDEEEEEVIISPALQLSPGIFTTDHLELAI